MPQFLRWQQMAYVHGICNRHFELRKLRKGFPWGGEWLQADLALPLTDEQLQNLKDEYRRKLVEDRSRAKSVFIFQVLELFVCKVNGWK